MVLVTKLSDITFCLFELFLASRVIVKHGITSVYQKSQAHYDEQDSNFFKHIKRPVYQSFHPHNSLNVLLKQIDIKKASPYMI